MKNIFHRLGHLGFGDGFFFLNSQTLISDYEKKF